MGRTTKATIIGGGLATTLLLSGCIAPDIDVVGAMGLTVTEDGRPVLVVEPCEVEAVSVTFSLDREGLKPEETNPQVAEWDAEPAAAGQTRIVLHDVQPPWKGPDVTVEDGRGYIAGGISSQVKGVLTQVSFKVDDLADLSPDTIYTNESPDSVSLRGHSPSGFVEWACGR